MPHMTPVIAGLSKEKQELFGEWAEQFAPYMADRVRNARDLKALVAKRRAAWTETQDEKLQQRILIYGDWLAQRPPVVELPERGRKRPPPVAGALRQKQRTRRGAAWNWFSDDSDEDPP